MPKEPTAPPSWSEPAWTMRKEMRSALCVLRTHALGLEVRVHIDGEPMLTQGAWDTRRSAARGVPPQADPGARMNRCRSRGVNAMEGQEGFVAKCPSGHIIVAVYTRAERAALATQVEPVRLLCVSCDRHWTPPAREQANIRRWARGETG